MDRGDYGKSYQITNLLQENEKDLWEQAFLARCELTDTLADLDNTLAEYVLEKESIENIPPLLLEEAVRRATINQVRRLLFIFEIIACICFSYNVLVSEAIS